jgi:glycosyltransferase involved in cell wall biosynthesis
MPPNIYNYDFKIKAVPAINNFFIDDADAIVASAWTTAYHVNKLNKKKGKKFYLIQDFEVWHSNTERAENSYKLPLVRNVVSKYLHDLLKSKFGVESNIISAGVSFEDFYNDNKIYHEPPAILFNDHLLEHKNVKGLLEVVKMLKEKYPKLVIRSFGVHQYNAMPDYVEFHKNPGDEELRQLYCDSDIFIFASKFEGFGTPSAEAMACKCALVANSVAAIPEYSVHMENAIHCNPGNPVELFNGVSYLIDNPAELKRISEAGYEQVRKLLSWDTAVEKFVKLI